MRTKLWVSFHGRKLFAWAARVFLSALLSCHSNTRKTLVSSSTSQPRFFHLAIPEDGTTSLLQPHCGHWDWGAIVSTSMALWLRVIWGSATDQLCLIIIFYHTESSITFSTHETYQVQSTSEQEMLDSCCYSFSERETGWGRDVCLEGSFTVTASYFPLWFLHVNFRGS